MVALSAAHPDWTATANLSLHATGWLLKGPVTVDSHLVRAGSNIVIVGSDILDGAGERAATSVAAFARLPRTASVSASHFDPAATLGQRQHLAPGLPPSPGSLIERSGVQVVDPEGGIVELPKRDYVINSFGSINGGVLGVVFQAAAEAAVPDLVATDVQIHYLRQAGSGPARTATTVLRRGTDHAACSVDVVDAGADNRVLALATVGMQRPPAG
jgi:acyl-coenzyme A thioesterase PaaI-like protein